MAPTPAAREEGPPSPGHQVWASAPHVKHTFTPLSESFSHLLPFRLPQDHTLLGLSKHGSLQLPRDSMPRDNLMKAVYPYFVKKAWLSSEAISFRKNLMTLVCSTKCGCYILGRMVLLISSPGSSVFSLGPSFPFWNLAQGHSTSSVKPCCEPKVLCCSGHHA